MRWLITLLLMASGTAVAQPSDNEMFAAYCYGVFEQTSNAPLTPPEKCDLDKRLCIELQRAVKVTLAENRRKMDRLRQYLLMRGVESGSALAPVKERGRAEAKACLQV